MRTIYITSWAPDLEFNWLDYAIPWERQTEARQEYFMSADSVEYTYGTGRGERTYVSHPFTDWAENIRLNLNAEIRQPGNRYNICFFNRYEDEREHLGWHADDSPGMDHNHPIAVVSFGQPREIWWKRKDQKGAVPLCQRQLLANGSLFVMPAGFQLEHFHRIPKGDRKMGPRISLTFRHYVPLEK